MVFEFFFGRFKSFSVGQSLCSPTIFSCIIFPCDQLVRQIIVDYLFLEVSCCCIINIIIHSKYSLVSDWLKPRAKCTITSCCWPNIEPMHDVKCAARCKLLNRWRQNDVKSAAHCRLLNRWPRKHGDKVVLNLVSGKQREKWQNSFKKGKIFWMNKKAIEGFCAKRAYISIVGPIFICYRIELIFGRLACFGMKSNIP